LAYVEFVSEKWRQKVKYRELKRRHGKINQRLTTNN